MELQTNTLKPGFFQKLRGSLKMTDEATPQMMVQTLLEKISSGTIQLVRNLVLLLVNND